ncbi:MAG: PRC-barrel domain-containing protein [Alphaproteobacteria bacterium]|nr:PRC-barrel domain-containing protein [Alphaproteobacteria bacterium]
MRTTAAGIVVVLCGVSLAQAQPAPTAGPTAAPAPVGSLDDTALGGSARASKLMGSKVYKGDTAIGQIEDVLVTLDHATVTAVILSVGGFLGIGNKLVAVPVTQIRVGSEAKFTTDLTREQLAAAPAFDFAALK